ncbi:hypothetical protein LCGC14_0678410 [marine sediment metagenome]|uniref:Uncharacterized protein n=2 Tax=root TaxID=1 RepID=A0A9C9TJ72_9HYPH|nr:hypothetical protein [Aurantimonas coralicida]
MTPTISFHGIELIALGPIAHFARDENNGGDFWTRDITLRDGDGEFTVALFSSTSAEQLEFAGGPRVISCSCGYRGADEAHTPPDSDGKLAAASDRLASRLEQGEPDDAA